MNDDKETCLKAGMDDYTSKPIQLEKLIGILEKWGKRIKSQTVTEDEGLKILK